MKQTLNVVTLLVAMSCLAGCNITAPDYEGPDAGYVVMSIGAKAGVDFSRYSIGYRSVDGTKPEMFFYLNPNVIRKPPNDYESDEETGVVEVRALAPGNYELYNFSAYWNNGVRDFSVESLDDFSVPFQIRPGETAYLGRFQANALLGEDFFGRAVTDGVYYLHSEASEQDLAIAKRRKPSFDLSQVTLVPMPEDVLGVYFFDSPETPEQVLRDAQGVRSSSVNTLLLMN